MKKLRVWIILLSLTKLITAELFAVSSSARASGEFFNSNRKFKEAYCITDDLDSALIWNYNLDWQSSSFDNSDESHSTYLLPRNQKYIYPTSDNLNCWMNYNSECSRHWQRHGNWTFKNNMENPTAPVTDSRWEDFDELKLNHLFRRTDVLSDSGSLSVSVRGSSDFHLAICEGQNAVDSFCFFIIIGGWKNTRSVIRKCENGIPESTNSYPTGECAMVLVEHSGPVLSAEEWRHFVLKWHFKNEISITVFDSNSVLLDYQAIKTQNYFAGEKTLNSQHNRYYLHARTSGHMLMKPHAYSYSMATTTQSKLISPPIMSPNKYLCVDMSVSLCDKCIMTVDYVDYKNTMKSAGTFLNKAPNRVYDLPVWQSVRINQPLMVKNETMTQPVKLVINTFLSDTDVVNPYWAVSNLRRCNDDMLKLTRVKTFEDWKDNYFWPNVTCQKMSANGDTVVIEANNDTPTTTPTSLRRLCTEGTIGPSCSANCSSLFSEHPDCQQLLACDKKGCTCAPGFAMPTCENYCPASMYGYECEKSCGNCAQDLCKPSTGECTYGCANTDKYYFLPPYCKSGIGPPPAPIIEFIQFTSVKVSSVVLPEYKIIPTNVIFEIWTNSMNLVFKSEIISVNKNTVDIEADAENLNPGTCYRVIVVVHAGKRTFRGQWTNFTTPCTESVALNFVITSNETSISVNNFVDVHVNDSCPYTWYHVQLLKEKKTLFDNSTSFPVTFGRLEPYTPYRVVVRSENSTVIVDRDVNTLEGAPHPVKNLNSISSHSNNITITWTSPDKPYGKIVNYTLEIQPTNAIGCSNYKLPSYNTTISQRLKQQIAITNITENTVKYTFSGLRPYTEYLVTVYAYTSRHQGVKTTSKYTTKQTEIPTEVFTAVHLSNEKLPRIAGVLKWNIPSDCTSIGGSMRAFRMYYRELGELNYKIIEDLNYNYYNLEKNSFNGATTYQGRLHVLRDMGGMESKVFAEFQITLPAREPPPIRNLETVEVDVHNATLTLRWEPPMSPIHGHLESYSIMGCSTESNCDESKSISVKFDEFCDLWESNIGVMLSKKYLCRTIPLTEDRDYKIIMVQAHNLNVREPSEPKFLQVTNTEFVPTKPISLFTELINPQNASINVSWAHPWKTGGRLQKFLIVATVINSNLKFLPWKEKIEVLEIGNLTYKPQYDLILYLLPSTTFSISVKGVTVGQLNGEIKENKITLPNFVNFSSVDLRPKVSHDLTIRIRIPEVSYNVVNGTMVVIVQGPKYCDEGSSNNEDVEMYLTSQSSSYYEVAWKAATIMEPEAEANKEFTIGDGLIYGGSKNYALCPTESYIVNVIISSDVSDLQARSNNGLGRNILRTIQTNAIQIGEKPQNYAIWLTPVFFIILIGIILFFVLHRKKIAKHFYNKSKVSQQENMPLSNDFSKKKPGDESDAVMIIKETKDFPKMLLIDKEPKSEFAMPIKLEDFERYFETACRSGALHKEYSTIQRGAIKACSYGSQTETKPKNRYANLYPYDESRVILEKLPEDSYSDYINANFIKGYGEREKAYIATQGPKPHTVIDFWRMIWQEKVQIICMMANLVENGKLKCEQYWPSAVGKKVLYGKVSVQFTSEEVHLDYTYRTFKVTCNEEIRTVEHLHYTSWPDHGVPSNPGSIVAFLKEIHKHSPVPRKPEDPPIVVHCSAGVGRTGTLIVLDKSLCRAFSEQVIDVHADVLAVREQRMNLVDNTEQYLLVHLVLVEYFNSENTCFSCDKMLPERIAKARQNASSQYQRILDTSWWSEVLGLPPLPEKSLSNINRAKHRFPESAAGNLNRLYLKRSVITDEDSDYIAATNVRSIFKCQNYITTQLPLPSTSADFWRMLSEHNIHLVLVLQRPDLNDPSYCELVPESQGFGNTKYLKVILQKGNTTSAECYSTEEVLIIDSSEQPIKDQIVTIITYKNWPDTGLPPASDIVKLWHLLEKYPKKEKSPIAIVCRDGVKASGLWLASSFLLNRMTIDKECDVFQAVRAIRRCRKNFLNEPESLEYLYDVALALSGVN